MYAQFFHPFLDNFASVNRQLIEEEGYIISKVLLPQSIQELKEFRNIHGILEEFDIFYPSIERNTNNYCNAFAIVLSEIDGYWLIREAPASLLMHFS